jgi:hypothetical protein
MGYIITRTKKKKSHNIEKLLNGEKYCTNNKDIANIFNKFFSTIAEELSKKFPA